ncbi:MULTISPECIES: asparaginase [unclassified Helicobacter]|uniref:asparaginase n=1 Tax=unclassified Helicobacter TaxID=2593540 RepID=UPI000CF15345|nr:MULTISPECIES: asparaginase [unclassified Helicobacter]
MFQISIGSIGGTISMTKNHSNEGITPTLGANDLIQALPQLPDSIKIKPSLLFSIASANISFSHLFKVYQWAKDEIKNGSNAIIITQGTDTLEESAFFLSLLWELEAPLIFTGAMKGANSIGSDGISNLYCSLLVALHSQSKGVMVVMNHTIHHPLWLQKTHSLSLETFSSFGKEIGVVLEENVEFFYLPKLMPIYSNFTLSNKKVFAYEHKLDDEEKILQWASQNYDGIVIEGYGAGHTHLKSLPIIEEIAKQIPVIMCARTHQGPSAIKTYGYDGGEIDLQSKNVIMSRWLQAKKARILLYVLLNSNLNTEDFISYRDLITQR